MLKEAIELLLNTGRSEKSVSIVQKSRRVKVAYAGGVQLWEVADDPPDRSHRVATLESFCDAVREFGDKLVSIWIQPSLVRAVLDEAGYRSNCVYWAYDRADEFEALEVVSPMGQRELVRWLRKHQTGPEADRLLQMIRHIQFSRRSDGSRTVEHGKESLGRSVEAAVNSPEGLPSEVEFRVPFFKLEFPERYAVRVRLEVDVDNERFELLPVPGELDRVTLEALRRLQGAIDQELVSRGVEEFAIFIEATEEI